jgi:hypothetical protein
MKKFDQIMDSYFQKIGLKDQLRQRKWLQKWPEAVGVHISRYTRPLVLKGGVLWVEVSDSNWLYHLTTLQEKIKDDFNNVVGFEVTKKIKLINAGSFAQEREVVQAYVDNTLEEKNKRLARKNDNKTPILEQKEIKEIEKLVENVPDLFKDKFRNFMKHIYQHQKTKIHEGAVNCRVCGLPCYVDEMRENLCFFCYRESEQWIKSLQFLFTSRPWLNFSDLKEWFFPPREELFNFCKEKIRKKYFNRIMDLVTEEGVQKECSDNSLNELILFYILFVTGKEPPLIQPEDEFRALKDFAGLVKSLEGGKIENNNFYTKNYE